MNAIWQALTPLASMENMQNPHCALAVGPGRSAEEPLPVIGSAIRE